MLTPSQAREALQAFADAVTGNDTTACIEGATWLRVLGGRDWLQLDDHARSYGYMSGGAPVSGTRGWLGSNLAEKTGFVAAVTSLHADGRIRQRATKVLAGSPGVLRAAALALRCLDHVPQVREDALLGLRLQTAPEAASSALGVLLAGRQRQHAPQALASYLDALFAVHDEQSLLPTLQASADRRVRRWAFEAAHDRGLLSTDELMAAVRGERDQFVRALAAQWLKATATPAQLLELLGSRFVDGRLLALTCLDDGALDTTTLLSLLDDPSARVRETAQWRTRRRDVNPASMYRGWLVEGARGTRRVAAALDGLSVVGAGQDDADLAGTYLPHASPAVRANAVAAVAVLGTPARVREQLRPLLLDPSSRVCSAAARGLARAGASGTDAEPAWASEQPWSRRAGWRLSRSAGSWDRVDADLRAAADDDAQLSGLGRAALRNWLHAGAATTWGQPAPALRNRMTARLATSGLSRNERRELAFHAGLELAPEPSPEPLPDDVSPVRPRWLRLLRRL